MEATNPHAREANSLVSAGQIRPLPRRLHLTLLYDFDLSSLICFAASQQPYSSLLRDEATADTIEQEVALTTVLMRYHCCLSEVAWYHDRLAYIFGASIISAMGLSLLCSEGVVGT